MVKIFQYGKELKSKKQKTAKKMGFFGKRQVDSANKKKPIKVNRYDA